MRQLGSRRHFQREYLLASIDRQPVLAGQGRVAVCATRRSTSTGCPIPLAPAPYVTLDYAPLAERMQAYHPLRAEPFRGLRADPRQPAHADGPHACCSTASIPSAGWPTTSATTFRPSLPRSRTPRCRRTLPRPTEAAAAAMQELTDWLQSNRASATEDLRAGPGTVPAR